MQMIFQSDKDIKVKCGNYLLKLINIWITKLINMNMVASNITDRVLISHYLSRPEKTKYIISK